MRGEEDDELLRPPPGAPLSGKLTLIALIPAAILVITTKALTGRWTPSAAVSRRATPPSRSPRGSLSRSCSARMEHRFFVSTVMFFVAVLVAHMRIELACIRRSVVDGALLGVGVNQLIVFQLFF